MATEHGATVIGAQDFEQEVLHAAEPVLVDFYATWCGPCRALAPTLDQLAGDLAGKARVVKVDVDQAQELASRYGVTSIPCLVVFKDGREVERFVGLAPKSRLAGALQQAIAA